MNVLVLNAGSSSLKLRLFEITGASPSVKARARGAIERIGGRGTATFAPEGALPRSETVEVPDHADAARQALEWVRSLDQGVIHAVGHRVVHGGERFTAPARIDDEVVSAVGKLEELAPLHNRPSLQAIGACRRLLGPSVPMVAVFDTAFHTTLPEHARHYAIPWDLASKHAIRRYGFHGTSYRSVLSRYAEITGTPPERATLIALHLGAGCSAAAIRAGQSVDTSMGFTPLEGLVMGTRAGDLDPAIVSYLARAERTSAEEVVQWLNDRSGLLGISGRSRDVRDLLSSDDPRARLAIQMFCYRARKYLGAYLAALGGAEAVVFTGGIGEHSPEVRAEICSGMEWCGLAIDPERNRAAVGREAMIGAVGARIGAFVIPADEEIVIARDTVACLEGRG
jgi:acetate kinase